MYSIALMAKFLNELTNAVASKLYLLIPLTITATTTAPPRKVQALSKLLPFFLEVILFYLFITNIKF